MTDVYIIGGSGYTGGELLRILSNHPKIGKISISSRQYQGKKVSELHQNVTLDLKFEDYNQKKANDADFVFTCTPHTKAMEYAVQLDTRIIDLSADFRLKNVKTFEETYQVKHTAPELVPQAVYGLPELHRSEIKKARLVANPGCLATGAILALYPLRKYKPEIIVVDSKTGISGAGKEPSETTHFCNVDENVIPYKVATHRHIPEMEQETGMKVHFTPHIAPMTRGIETTVHAFGLKGDVEKIKDSYKEAYKGEPFTKVVDGIPTVLSVRGSNYCHIGGFTESRGRLVLFSALDNLVKGASGAAVQNMNVMAGFKETEGLGQLGLCP